MRIFRFLICAPLLVAPAVAAEPVRDPQIFEGLQVGVGRCMFAADRTNDEQSKFLTAVASAAISAGINLLGKAITNAGAAKTWHVEAARNFQADERAFPNCIQVVRGRFSKGTATVGALGGVLKSRSALLQGNGLYPADDPDFFLEAKIVASNDGAALAIRPIYASFGKAQGERGLRGSGRSIAVFFAITAPGTAPTLATAPGATIVLGKLESGQAVNYLDESGISSPFESAWFALTRSQSVKPLTITAMLSETQKEDKFLTFIGGLATDEKVKSAANQQVTQLLIPSVGAAADRADDVTERAAESVADEKFGAAQGKLLLCVNAPPATLGDAAIVARVALRDFLTADQDPKLKKPRGLASQSQINAIDPAKPATVVQACQNAYSALVN